VYGGSTPELDKKIRSSLGIKGRIATQGDEVVLDEEVGEEAERLVDEQEDDEQ
jgi:hypothetical protein